MEFCTFKLVDIYPEKRKNARQPLRHQGKCRITYERAIMLTNSALLANKINIDKVTVTTGLEMAYTWMDTLQFSPYK